MKKIICLIILIGCGLTANAQPKSKPNKCVFTLKTFDAVGTMIASSYGFFCGKNGEAVSNMSAFEGAAKATVIDGEGKERTVNCILGANRTYDIVKFKVDDKGLKSYLPVTNEPPSEGQKVWIIPYSFKKQPQMIPAKITNGEAIQDNRYWYYTLLMEKRPENVLSCPVVTEDGNVIGLFQPSSQNKDDVGFAVSAAFANDLKTTGLSINDAALKSTSIKKALPDNKDQAVLALYIAGSTLDSTRTATYTEMVEDFIAKFPTASDGYISRAQLAIVRRDYASADKDMKTALDVADKKEEVHYNLAKMIIQKELTDPSATFPSWTLDRAADEAAAAYACSPAAIYRDIQASVRTQQKRHHDAYTIYRQMMDSGEATAETFLNASRCKEILGDTVAAIALLDSAILTFSQPYLKVAAPYFIARAMLLTKAGRYRQAFNDFNEYERLMPTEVNDYFYYIRSQACIGGKMYQPALNDLATAISKSPSNPLYYAEKASLEIQVNLLDDAVQTASQCIAVDPENSDGYLFLGLALCLQGKKSEGRKNLEKAKSLGDTQAETLIRKYGTD